MSNGDGEGAVREALKKIHDVEKSVKDFEEHERDLLAQRINAFVSSLEDVRKTLGVVEAKFPVELLRRLDTGINPDKFVVDAFHTCVVENQKVKGKATNLEKFHAALVEQAALAFPEDFKKWRSERASDETGQDEQAKQ